jgi:thiamine transport system substrate-binding protein
VRGRLVAVLLVGVGLVFSLLVARQLVLSRSLPHAQFSEHKLRLLTYSTFVGASGPGHEIIERFEKENGCTVEVATSTDAGLLLERLKLAPADVVLGLDQLLLEQAQKEFQWQEIPEDRAIHAPEAAYMPDPHFAVFDWSPLTFVYRSDGGPVPKTVDEMLSPKYVKQFALEDPRLSTPGLQFYRWIQALKGAQTAAWLKSFQPNVNSISPSWAFAYGLFKKKQTRFVFSYLTSLAFHWGDEKDRSYQVLSFPEGHPIQVEIMAIPAACRECDLAQKFVRLVQSEWAQGLIMKKNYMFPVRGGLVPDSLYGELPRLKTIATPVTKDMSDWDKVFGH